MAKVQFARNLNEEAALESEQKDTIYFSKDTHSIVMGGNVYGGISSECNVTEEQAAYLKKLYDEMIEAKFTIKTTGASNKLPGDTVTLYVDVKWEGAYVEAGTATVTTVGTEISWTESATQKGKFEATYEIPEAQTGSKTFNVTVKYGDYTKTSTVSVTSYNKVSYGWAESDSISALSDIQDIATKSPSSSAAGTYEFTNTKVGYYYIAIPSGTSVPTSLLNGYGTENDVTQVLFVKLDNAITGYSVFRLADPQAAGATHKVKFA